MASGHVGSWSIETNRFLVWWVEGAVYPFIREHANDLLRPFPNSPFHLFGLFVVKAVDLDEHAMCKGLSKTVIELIRCDLDLPCIETNILREL